MAIFNKSDKQADYASNVTTIAAGASFTGTIEIACSLHLDGEFIGDINSTNTVEIGKSGVLKGELKAQKLVLSGKFLGNAECESIELLAGGDAEGKLITDSLAIDSDSLFQGESIRKKPVDAKADAKGDSKNDAKGDSASKGDGERKTTAGVPIDSTPNPFKDSAPAGKKTFPVPPASSSSSASSASSKSEGRER